MIQDIEQIYKILQDHEKKLKGLSFDKIMRRVFKHKTRWDKQNLMSFTGIHLALVVDSRDPWKQNRIRYFSPTLNTLASPGTPTRGVELESLDWAHPISSMGGFDDCGLSWVPPPGSTVAIIFQHGSTNMAFYLGTTWQRYKGPEGQENWGYSIPEYEKIFRGHRKGYMVGMNDESQSLPSNNTSNYQGFDFDDSQNIDLIPDASTKTTWPHEYRIGTPEKHRFTMDDGDPRCNRRNKRLEIISSMGAYFIMKDDPYHNCGNWTNPKCSDTYISMIPDVCVIGMPSVISISAIPSAINLYFPYTCDQGPDDCPTDYAGTTMETMYLGTEHLCPSATPFPESTSVPGDCMGILKGASDFCFSFNNAGNNRYHKHRQECFPFFGNKCGLPQSGVQIIARSGSTIAFDDSVEEPRGRPEWERTLEPFDMDGCTGVFKGRTWWRSATGHYMELNDEEVNPKIRGPRNGINIGTASGNKICLNDYTKEGCVAGETRGVFIGSTSDHSIELCDNTNQQCSPEREGCGKTGPWAKSAFVRIRSGYGLQLMFSDAQSQTRTDQQYIELLAPQKDNLQRGPHMFRMQEKATGPGQVFLRSGGDYVIYTYDTMMEIVGNEKDNPANKLELISNMKIVSVKDVYYNKAKTHCFYAADQILLGAGKDCAESDDPDAEGTCLYPVVVAYRPIPEFISQMTGLKASEHVFASAVRESDDICEGVASE